MAQLSLGLIETIGLVAAVEAADAAVKAANVKLVGYELTRGDGMTTIKVLGEVGAVNAAIAAAVAAAARVNRVVSTRVIARPAEGIGGLIANADTVGARCAAVAAPAVLQAPTAEKEPEPSTPTPAQGPPAEQPGDTESTAPSSAHPTKPLPKEAGRKPSRGQKPSNNKH